MSRPPRPTQEQVEKRCGHLEIGPKPRFMDLARWCTVADVPNQTLVEVESYVCHRAISAPVIDGDLTKEMWVSANWSKPLGHICDGIRSGHESRVALLWDDDYLYAAFKLRDPDIRAQTTRHHEQVYVLDDDAEFFLEFDGGYYELGVNAINTVYEFNWTWIDQLIEDKDWEAIEELLKTPDYLYYTRRSSEILGRIGNRDFDLPGLKHAVTVDGSINNPGHEDFGWCAEFALPWASLNALSRTNLFPPSLGDTIRAQAYRVQHDWSHSGDKSHAAAPVSEGYTWSVMGNSNVHNPERWTRVTFKG